MATGVVDSGVMSLCHANRQFDNEEAVLTATTAVEAGVVSSSS